MTVAFALFECAIAYPSCHCLCLQVKELAGDAVRDQLPAVVSAGIQRHVPSLIDMVSR